MVECTALEMRRAGNGTEGSNPSLSAIIPSASVLIRPPNLDFPGVLRLDGLVGVPHSFTCVHRLTW